MFKINSTRTGVGGRGALQAMYTVYFCSAYLQVAIKDSGFIFPGRAGCWWSLKGIGECEEH